MPQKRLRPAYSQEEQEERQWRKAIKSEFKKVKVREDEHEEWRQAMKSEFEKDEEVVYVEQERIDEAYMKLVEEDRHRRFMALYESTLRRYYTDMYLQYYKAFRDAELRGSVLQPPIQLPIEE